MVTFAEDWRTAAWGRHLARQRGQVATAELDSRHDELVARVAALLHFLTGQPGLIVQGGARTRGAACIAVRADSGRLHELPRGC